MSTLKIPGEISISRPSYGDGNEAIEITITDSGSGIEFVRAKISLDVFSPAPLRAGAEETAPWRSGDWIASA